MWDNWYCPKFLLRDGSLTLMYMTSLMFPVRFCDSLPTVEKCPYWYGNQWCWQVINEGQCPEIFLKVSPKVLAESPRSNIRIW